MQQVPPALSAGVSGPHSKAVSGPHLRGGGRAVCAVPAGHAVLPTQPRRSCHLGSAQLGHRWVWWGLLPSQPSRVCHLGSASSWKAQLCMAECQDDRAWPERDAPAGLCGFGADLRAVGAVARIWVGSAPHLLPHKDPSQCMLHQAGCGVSSCVANVCPASACRIETLCWAAEMMPRHQH